MTTAVEPREHTIEARGLRFHYVEWGRADTPAIVLLHGISAMCRIWDSLAQALQARYRLIALDQRGHGGTSLPHRAAHARPPRPPSRPPPPAQRARGGPPGPDEPAYATDDYVADLGALVDGWGL